MGSSGDSGHCLRAVDTLQLKESHFLGIVLKHWGGGLDLGSSADVWVAEDHGGRRLLAPEITQLQMR